MTNNSKKDSMNQRYLRREEDKGIQNLKNEEWGEFGPGEFTMVPFMILEGLKPIEQVTLLWLLRHADRDSICWPSHELLAKECGSSQRTIARALSSLKEKRIILTRPRYNKSGQTSNEYVVLIRFKIQ